MPNQAIQFSISRDNAFFIQYFYPDEDHSYSWKMHNGLGGHIEKSKRLVYHENLARNTIERIEGLNTRPEKREHINTLVSLANLLTLDLGGAKSDIFKQLVSGKTLNYHLISGYSRSGGTYLLSEHAKMRGEDLLKKHLYWIHDFFPYFKRHDLFASHLCREDVLMYLTTLIASLIQNNEHNFFRRTTLGPALIPYFEKLNEALDINLVWRHCVRDLHGVVLSMQKMYADDKVEDSQYYKEIMPIYELRGACPSILGSYATVWFLTNLSVLPIHKGLPFVDHFIDMEQTPKRLIKQVNLLIDNYLATNKKIIIPERLKPVIMKFGSQFDKQCLIDAEKQNAEAYKPGKLNYTEKPEIDDPYLPVYYCFLENLTRLYQHFDIGLMESWKGFDDTYHSLMTFHNN